MGEEDTLEIDFTVDSVERPKIKVMKDDKNVANSHRFRLIETVDEHSNTFRYKLVCDQPDIDDDGVYEIVAINNQGECRTSVQVVEKQKIQKPRFVKTFKSQKIAESNQLLLEVKTEGYPVPKIVWFHNGARILPSETTLLRQRQHEGALAISNVKASLHEGVYECRIENIYGRAVHSEKVTISHKVAKFLERSRDVEVYENEKALLVVKVSTTEDNVTWYKDGRRLSGTIDSDYEFIKTDHYRKLLIENADVGHQGEYTCELEGGERCASDLVVIEMLPDITRHLKDVNIICGETAQFVVELSKGDAVLQWYKDGKEIMFNDRVHLEIDGKQQRLVVDEATLDDAGAYSCSIGGQSSKAKLAVEYPCTEFIRRLQDEYLVDEECETHFEVEISRSDVDVFWYKNGEEMKETANIKFYKEKTVRRMVIRHTKMSDCGEYICLAKGDQTRTELSVSREPLVFNLKLKDFNVKEGETITFSTEVADKNYTVRWLKNNEEIELDAERMVVSDNGKYHKLIIRNANLDDNGIYTAVCEGQRASSKVSVLTPPKVTSDTKRFTAVRGDNFTLDVPFEGYPIPKVEWYYSGRLLKTSKKVSVEILMSRTVLTIKNFDDADIGLYKLCLENSVGQYTTHFELLIIDRPDPPTELSVVNITNNSAILTWEKPKKDNGSPITNYVVEYKDVKSATWKDYDDFIIEENVKMKNLKHNSTYVFRVYAVNRAGQSVASAESRPTTISEQVDSGDAPVVIMALPATVHGTPFQTVNLECKIIGATTIEWKHKDRTITADEDNFLMLYEKEKATLVIKECRFDLADRYECVASNDFGSAATATKVVLEEKPSAKFDGRLKNIKIKQGTQLSIYCQVFGYPFPEICWYKGGSPVARKDHIKVVNESDTTLLKIDKVSIEDSGIYSLKLVNSAGEAQYDFEVKLLNRPGPPDLPIRCTNCDDYSIELSWNPPKDDGGSPIQFYQIESCETKFLEWQQITQVTANNFTYNIYNLMPDAKYRFRICSINEFGASDYVLSEPIICKSPYERPSPPTGPLRTSDHTQDSLILYWNPPENDGNSAILEYVVEMREENRTIWKKVGTADGETQSIKIEDLVNEKNYQFRVLCRNRFGVSEPYCSEELITAKCKFGAPTKPIGPLSVTEMTNTSVTLSWRPPQSNGGLALTSYIIERKLTFENNWIRETMVDSDTLSYTVSNLFAKYEYDFRVIAENPLGQSEPLQVEAPIQLAQNATPPGVPSAPLEMRVVSPSAIVIEWGKPEHDGGSPITGYVVAAKDARRTMWMQVGKVEADVHRLQIKDLQEGRAYQVRVMAQNEIGLSDPLVSEEPIQVVRPQGNAPNKLSLAVLTFFHFSSHPKDSPRTKWNAKSSATRCR